MENQNEIKALGKLDIVVKDEHGSVKQELTVDNLVVDVGLAYIASRMKDATATAMTHMELGTGTTAAAAGNTTLETIISGSMRGSQNWLRSTFKKFDSKKLTLLVVIEPQIGSSTS